MRRYFLAKNFIVFWNGPKYLSSTFSLSNAIFWANLLLKNYCFYLVNLKDCNCFLCVVHNLSRHPYIHHNDHIYCLKVDLNRNRRSKKRKVSLILIKFQKLSKLSVTAWKVSVFGVLLVRIFQHSDLRWSDTPYLSVFSPNAGKYVATFTLIVTLVKHSDDAHWNVRTNI